MLELQEKQEHLHYESQRMMGEAHMLYMHRIATLPYYIVAYLTANNR
jgi:hypothetical protein